MGRQAPEALSDSAAELAGQQAHRRSLYSMLGSYETAGESLRCGASLEFKGCSANKGRSSPERALACYLFRCPVVLALMISSLLDLLITPVPGPQLTSWKAELLLLATDGIQPLLSARSWMACCRFLGHQVKLT